MRRALIAITAAALSVAATAARAQDVVRPEVAYPYEVEATADRLLVDFALLDGYYLYRDKFAFAVVDSTDVTLAAPRFPRGEAHSDEFFGEQEIYRHDFRIEVPYTRSGGPDEVDLQIRLQGCADIGLCYPPQRWTRSVALPAAAAAGASSTGRINPFALGGGAVAANQDQLPVDEAFVANPRFDAANELTIAWQIAPGYYLYRDKFEVAADGGIEFGPPRLPPGQPHYDDNFGDVEVYYGDIEIVVPFARATPDEIPVTITAGFQGCKEMSICYPPSETTMALVVPPAGEFASGSSTAVAAGAAAPAVMVSEQDRFGQLVESGSWLSVIGFFFVAGLLLSFTPCVLPMVPILSSIIVGAGGTASPRRGFALSLAYVLGMAATYAAAGAVTALAGSQVQAMFQKPWIISIFAGLFAVLALGMFGLFEIQMPTAVQSRLSQMANRQKAGTFLGTAVIGALSALIVTTCVAPPLIGALGVIAQTGEVDRGATALFALGLGMGSPLLVVGASAGKLLPRVGPWMNTVKAAFGVLMMGMAIWMIERVLPGTVTLVLWSLLVFLTGVFLGAFEPLPESPSVTKRLGKGLGVLACLYGALMLIGATLGGEDPLEPLPRGALVSAGGPVAAPELEFRAVGSVAELETLLASARSSGQPVMIDFTADWCVSCREMEEYTFPDAGVVAALEPFMLLRADVTENDDDDQALLEYFSSFGPPTIAFFDSAGNALNPYKLVGYVEAEQFAAHVTAVASL